MPGDDGLTAAEQVLAAAGIDMAPWQRAVLAGVLTGEGRLVYRSRRSGRAYAQRMCITLAAVRGEHAHYACADGTWCATWSAGLRELVFAKVPPPRPCQHETAWVLDEAVALDGYAAGGQDGGSGPPFTCPACGMTSYSAADARHGYCGRCHACTGQGGAGLVRNVAIDYYPAGGQGGAGHGSYGLMQVLGGGGGGGSVAGGTGGSAGGGGGGGSWFAAGGIWHEPNLTGGGHPFDTAAMSEADREAKIEAGGRAAREQIARFQELSDADATVDGGGEPMAWFDGDWVL